MAMVSVLQFAEGLTDRQAADAVRGRVDWKFMLGLALEDPGSDASVLSEFRTRLTGDGQADRLLALMLQHLCEHRLLDRGGRQRTDATHVHAAIRLLNRLELAMETLRAALEVLAVADPVWLLEHTPLAWWERYAQLADDFRLPQSEAGRTVLAVTVGADGYRLLDAVHHSAAPVWLRDLPALRVLRQVWVQQYHRDQGGHHWRGKDDLPPGGTAIGSPYDTDARYGIKRGMGWRGYKGHFTEVCEPDRPHVIVHVATSTATLSNVETVTTRHHNLAAADLLPEQELVDAAYVSVDHILDAATDHGITHDTVNRPAESPPGSPQTEPHPRSVNTCCPAHRGNFTLRARPSIYIRGLGYTQAREQSCPAACALGRGTCDKTKQDGGRWIPARRRAVRHLCGVGGHPRSPRRCKLRPLGCPWCACPGCRCGNRPGIAQGSRRWRSGMVCGAVTCHAGCAARQAGRASGYVVAGDRLACQGTEL
ncbi:transposase [Streptomyces sp. ISL-11]|nr:transposase [Streptomyces sp. ISL-11]